MVIVTKQNESAANVERLQEEGLVSLRDASMNAFKGSVHPYVLKRWHKRGSKSQRGSIVHLEMILVGKIWYTSHAALNRYLTALNER